MRLIALVFALLTLGVGVAFLPFIKEASEAVADAFGTETYPPFLKLIIDFWPVIIFILLLVSVVFLLRSRTE